MKTRQKDNRRIWWDNHLRLWTMQTVDADGDQVDSVEYTADRRLALAWLESGQLKSK
jgi:hypothetical protein